MTAMTAKIAGIIAPAIDAIVEALIAAGVAHVDETGFRVAGSFMSTPFAAPLHGQYFSDGAFLCNLFS